MRHVAFMFILCFCGLLAGLEGVGASSEEDNISGIIGVGIILNTPPRVVSISVDSNLMDRDIDYENSGAVENVEITIRVSDNDNRDDISYVGIWIRDNKDTIVVDNAQVAENTSVNENTLDFKYVFNCSDSLLDNNLGAFDVKAQVIDGSGAENTEPFTGYGSELFTVDDLFPGMSFSDRTPSQYDALTVSGTASRLFGSVSLDGAWIIDEKEGTMIASYVSNTYARTYQVTASGLVSVDVTAAVLDGRLDGSISSSYTVSTGITPPPPPPSFPKLQLDVEYGVLVGGLEGTVEFELRVSRIFYDNELMAVSVRVTDEAGNLADADVIISYYDPQIRMAHPVQVSRMAEGTYRGHLAVGELEPGGYVLSVVVQREAFESNSTSAIFEVREGMPPQPAEKSWLEKHWGAVLVIALAVLFGAGYWRTR